MTLATLTYIVYALIAVVIGLIAWVIWLQVRLARLLAGKDAKSLEDTIVRLREELSKLFDYRKQSESRLDNHESRLKRAVQWVETIRFNPFAGQGGNQSWSTLLMDEKGDGVVFTGLWGRDKSSVYAKPIKNHGSEHELSSEEKELLTRVGK